MHETALNNFVTARNQFIAVIDNFPVEKRLTVLFDKWSLRDILVHIAGWDRAITENIRDLKQGNEPPFYGKIDDFNANSIEHGKNWTWEKTYIKFVQAGEKMIYEYETLSDGLWEKPFWKSKNSTPAKFLKIETKHYFHEHLPEIKMIISQLSDTV
ncbi:ClbS/DfsB family four-helix bundle protein [Candidatus Roizmanbacteria bacterium]|nr:ClbS/DfsB family four-helix bundle protein [Candidatus Roizmanbacteria bacterium]